MYPQIYSVDIYWCFLCQTRLLMYRSDFFSSEVWLTFQYHWNILPNFHNVSNYQTQPWSQHHSGIKKGSWTFLVPLFWYWHISAITHCIIHSSRHNFTYRLWLVWKQLTTVYTQQNYQVRQSGVAWTEYLGKLLFYHELSQNFYIFFLHLGNHRHNDSSACSRPSISLIREACLKPWKHSLKCKETGVTAKETFWAKHIISISSLRI